MERRDFVKGSLAFAGIAASLAGGETLFRAVAHADDLLRPPGIQSEDDFMARCIKCGKCIEACPYRTLRAAPFFAGGAVGSPHLSPREHACRLCEDFPCVAACPTGALRDVQARQDVHMGIAVIDEDLCIAFEGNRCEVCYRACPLIDEAITIEYSLREHDSFHAVFAPTVNPEKCTGCGLCVERCVVDEPRVAIRIATGAESAEILRQAKNEAAGA